MPDQFLRPSPPFSPPDAHYSLMASLANDARLVAGQGISIKKGLNGTTISVRNPGEVSDMNFAGAYNYTSSYNVNDVVYVDPNVTITDQIGSVIPFGTGSGFLTPGLWICNTFVPALGIDVTLLTGSVAPVLTSQSQSVTSQVADQFRHYSLNDYFPTSPLPPGTTYVTESTWTTQSGSIFWLPLATNTSGGSSISEYPVVQVFDNYVNAGGQITSILLTATGSGFTTGTYSVGISGGGGAGGTAIYSASGKIDGVQLTSPGYGYTSNPAITFPSGSGTGASGSAAIASIVPVALPRLLQRRTYDGQTLNLPDGPHTYTYVAAGVRFDASADPVSGPLTASAIIWPPYLPDTGSAPLGWNYINVYSPPGGTGLTVSGMAITLMEIGTERDWLNVTPICYASHSAYLLTTSNPTATDITHD